MSIGSETVGGVRNVMVRNCTFEGTENGIRIKSRRGKGGVVENLSYSDITMKNVDPAITFSCYYMNSSKGDAVKAEAPPADETSSASDLTPVYRNIRVTNLKAQCADNAGVIMGLPDSRISNVVLENVRINAATTGLTIENATGIQLKNVQVTTTKGPPFIVKNAEVKGLNDAIGAQPK